MNPKKVSGHPAAGSGGIAGGRMETCFGADAFIDSLIDHFLMEAQRRGGILMAGDVGALREGLGAKVDAWRADFENRMEECVRQRVRLLHQQPRRNPLDRLIVGTFAHLLVPDTVLAERKDGISRRALPGFFLAINMMLGPELQRQLQERCRRVVARHRGHADEGLFWRKVGEDTEARAVLLDAEAAMLPYFADPDKRAAWFIGLLNQHMTPPEHGAETPSARWQMTGTAFFALLTGLFGEVRRVLGELPAANALTERRRRAWGDFRVILERIDSAAALAGGANPALRLKTKPSR